jgi:RNA polymerase sigma-70 factor (ECF subfamily)
MAEEIVQNIFLTIWLKRAELPQVQKPSTYLFTMVYNNIYHHFKRQALEKKALEEHKTRNSGPRTEMYDWLHTKEGFRFIQEAIRKLPAQQQLVYKLSREQHLTREEIAQKMNLSPHTVKNHLQEATKNIRDYLEGTGILTILLILGSGK